MIADGTDAQKIVFTSARDDTVGGDTNGDGNGTSPSVWDWRGIQFGPTSRNNVLDQVVIKYAGNGVYSYTLSLTVSNSTLSNNSIGIYVNAASPAISGNTISGNGTGIYLDNASPTITGNTINNSSYGIYTAGGASTPSISCSDINDNGYGIYSASESNPTIANCNITGNSNYGVYSDGSGSLPINAQNNWWSDASGPSGFGPGSGDAVSDYVNYSPWQTSYYSCISLEAHYTFDEGGGTFASDSSGNGNDGTISGATWTTGKNEGGLGFDGVNDYVTTPLINNDEVSISAWFYKNANDTTRNDAVFSGFRNNSNLQLREGFEFRFPSSASNTLEFVLVTQDGSGSRTARTARRNLLNSVGSWYHAVGTYNMTTGAQRLYINGELVHTATHPAGNTVVPMTYYPDMRIGYSRVNSGYFNGVIDDVRLYNRPLNDQEIRTLYTAFTGDLQARYTLDEGSGTIANDSSGNGNHGAINGGATWATGRSGTGLSFDGLDDYVTIPRINNDEISITAWFFKNANDTTRNDAIFGGFRNNSNVQLREGFELRFPSGASNNTLQFVLVTHDGSGTRTMRTAQWNLVNSVGSWYHATGTYNKTTGEQRLYVNGQLVNTQTHPVGNTIVPLTYYSDMRMGYSRVNAGYFNGVLDDVQLYKRALTDQEVLDIYNNP